MNSEQSAFAQTWRAELLTAPPPIAPARSFIWPLRIAGEEDALARGALNVMVWPRGASSYFLTCALGFRDPSMPTGVFACPNAEEICIVAGGYAYLAQASQPRQVTLLRVKPVVAILPVAQENLMLFVGFTSVLAWGQGGEAWQTGRLTWEGIRIDRAENGILHGFGWDLTQDAEVAFEVDLKTGGHRGGGWKSA